MRYTPGSPCIKCGEPSKAKGLCHEHFKESRRIPGAVWSSRRDAFCPVGGCGREVLARGLCSAHYQAELKGGYAPKMSCPIPGCDVEIRATSQYCQKHGKVAWRYSLYMNEMLELYMNRECGNPICRSTKDLHVDHDHACCGKGKFGTSHKVACGDCVRGWLCQNCNWGLGNFLEDPASLRAMAEYIESPPRVRGFPKN